MMSPDEDRVLEDLLFTSDLGDERTEPMPRPLREEEEEEGEEQSVSEESAQAPPPISVQEPITCSGCGTQVCERYFLLAVGGVWHDWCLRCSQCECELRTHASLYCRDGNIYCQQDYSRIFGGGQCARCYQPIPASDLVMRSGHMTFHPQCFSCQECDVKLVPGNLYCVQGQSLYCQSHGCRGDDGVPLSQNPLLRPQMKEDQSQASGEGEESVSSPEPRLNDRATGGRSHRRTKRIRTCFRSEQLRALESYFAQKQNPDGKDWTFLVHRTGLPKRVLQVWFQNARAKLRRSLTSDDVQANSPSVAPRAGVAMTTSTPPPPPCSPPFSTSTIDQLQLSLLTAPLGDVDQPRQLHSPPVFYLDYDSQNALGCVSSRVSGYDEADADPDPSFTPRYC
nr:LIM/homeobox protein Lhx9-like [Solea senegalensis]XP_043908917.1 LIM/homeobox protein Lhx9-like [Solea senegalensis]